MQSNEPNNYEAIVEIERYEKAPKSSWEKRVSALITATSIKGNHLFPPPGLDELENRIKSIMADNQEKIDRAHHNRFKIERTKTEVTLYTVGVLTDIRKNIITFRLRQHLNSTAIDEKKV